MQDHNKSILIVGGAGYIGSHTAKLLKRSGYHPVVLDDLSTGHKTATQYGPFYQGSCGDIPLVQKIIKEHHVDTVMHFCAKSIVPVSLKEPLTYYSTNVGETLNLLQAMHATGVKNFIFSSTCAVFGEPKEVPIHENVLQAPVTPYGWSKLFIERILKDMHTATGFNSVSLRYFNAAGADPDAELGEDHRPESHLLPRIINVALGREKKLTVYGNDYATKDGSCIRDYVHVNDLADAHIKSAQLLSKQGGHYDFNLGSEHGYSVLEVIRSVEKETGKTISYEIGPRRIGDPPVLIADSRKAHMGLKWKPQHDLDFIVKTAVAFMKKHPDGFTE